ncbi:MAG: hypothetical protein BMS9Abin34_407 [Patescibacteria group bacterium]|nr:MAG: hypothetical protein BMS9Abin34_407 [Patescibacteria group bacterium]
MRTLAFLNEIGVGDADSFGEEAAALGDLVQAGFPISPGFVLPSASYAEFLAGKRVKGILALCDSSDPDELGRLLFAISLPPRLVREIRGFYRSLSGPQDTVVSVRTVYSEKKVGSSEALLAAVKRFWIDHLVAICGRGRNVYKEPLPILVQQETTADVSGRLSTSAPELGSSDLCLVEVIHGDGKERIVFEKGTGKAVKRIVSGPVGSPTAVEELTDLSSWAAKIEQVLGGVYLLGWRRYRGEFVFDRIKRIFIPQVRGTAFELWIKVEEGTPKTVEGATGFVAGKAGQAVELAKQFPNRKVLLLLETVDFDQLDQFRTGRHKVGLKNLHLGLPPVRTIDGLREIKRHLSGERIQRGPNLKFLFRAFYPSNVVLLEDILEAGVDGVILDEKALAKGFLGTKEAVEPDESLLWVIKEAGRKCRAAGVDLFYLGDRARSWILFELVRSGVKGIIVPQRYQTEYAEALQEAEVERLSAHG